MKTKIFFISLSIISLVLSLIATRPFACGIELYGIVRNCTFFQVLADYIVYFAKFLFIPLVLVGIISEIIFNKERILKWVTIIILILFLIFIATAILSSISMVVSSSVPF